MNKEGIRVIVRGAYDIQKLRIQMGNRIVANFKTKLGQEPGKPEGEMSAEDQKFLNSLRVRYKKITDGITRLPKMDKFKGDEIISSYTELCLLDQYFKLEVDEENNFKPLAQVLNEYPIWTQWMSEVKGVGPKMAGVIISEIDIHAAEYPSSLWKYAGLDVGPDGLGRSRRDEHLVEVEYKSRDGEMKKRKSITYNPFLKAKLMGVLSGSFLKVGGGGPYRQAYDNYKNRIANMPAHADKTLKHRHNMALRYMIKRFLVDLYREWRTLEGLPVATEYSEGKLGIVHKKAS